MLLPGGETGPDTSCFFQPEVVIYPKRLSFFFAIPQQHEGPSHEPGLGLGFILIFLLGRSVSWFFVSLFLCLFRRCKNNVCSKYLLN